MFATIQRSGCEFQASAQVVVYLIGHQQRPLLADGNPESLDVQSDSRLLDSRLSALG
jgi:hypothetical protein